MTLAVPLLQRVYRERDAIRSLRTVPRHWTMEARRNERRYRLDRLHQLCALIRAHAVGAYRAPSAGSVPSILWPDSTV